MVGCSVSGCSREHHSKQYCELHYRRFLKNGSPELKTTEQRFWDKVDKTDTCWLWTGTKIRNGYGRFKSNGRLVLSHRYSYSLFQEIPSGLDIDHLCRTPSCVRPDHLEATTRRVNVVRGARVLNKKSGLPVGVYKHWNRFVAKAMINGKGLHLGVFDTPEQAYQAYLTRVEL